MKAAGTHGTLTAAGRWVATLGIWSAEIEPEGGTLLAALTDHDSFWLTALEQVNVALDVGAKRWVWRDAVIQTADARNIRISLEGRKADG